MLYNPKVVKFSHPVSFTDGTPFGVADYAGTEFAVAVDGGSPVPTVAIPVAFGDGTGSVPLADLDLPQRKTLLLYARTVAANGTVSDWSAPSAPFMFDLRKPAPPLALVVS